MKPKSCFNIHLEGVVQIFLTKSPCQASYPNIHASAEEICNSNIWIVEREWTPEFSDTAVISSYISIRTGHGSDYSISYFHLLSTESKLRQKRNHTTLQQCSFSVHPQVTLDTTCGMEKKESFLCVVELLFSVPGELPASMTRTAEAVSPAYRENTAMKESSYMSITCIKMAFPSKKLWMCGTNPEI